MDDHRQTEGVGDFELAAEEALLRGPIELWLEAIESAFPHRHRRMLVQPAGERLKVLFTVLGDITGMEPVRRMEIGVLSDERGKKGQPARRTAGTIWPRTPQARARSSTGSRSIANSAASR